MKLLPHSNGVRKVNMKKKMKPQDIMKTIAICIVIILVFGYICQSVSGFIAKETLKARVDYTTVDDMRMDYRIKGEGNYTVIFDSALGANLESWTPVINELEDDDVQAFVYNRRGYGYSSSGARRTPEEQARDLKILLRKAGVAEPYILVGEDYGSLVLTSFVQQFKDSVAAVVLIDPINEATLQTKEYKRSQMLTKVRRKIESIGSNFGLTMLLDKLNLDVNLSDLENGLEGEALHEFLTQRTKSKYTSAVSNEISNLTKGESNSQTPGVFSGVPYYLLTKENDEILESLGDKELTNVHISTSEKDFLSINDTDNIVNGIRYVIKQLEEIKIKNNQTTN